MYECNIEMMFLSTEIINILQRVFYNTSCIVKAKAGVKDLLSALRLLLKQYICGLKVLWYSGGSSEIVAILCVQEVLARLMN